MTTCSWRWTALLAALLAAAPALAAEEEPSLFAGGPLNAVITLIIFFSVVTILGKYAWPQLIKVLNEREQQIRLALEDAKREQAEAARLLAEYKKQIDRAREEATAIVEEGRRDANEVRRRMHEQTQAEAREMIERARREIQLATDAAVKELYDRTAELAVDIAAGIIKKELRPEDHAGLVRESVERMEASRN